MKAKPTPSAELLRAALRYDATTGTLCWRTRPRSISVRKFQVDQNDHGVRVGLGTFKTFEAAAEVRVKASSSRDFTERHGRAV